MAFVNEYIPAEDFKKFDFDKLNKRIKEMSGTTPSDAWTIDREADIWLREFYTKMDHTAPDGGFTGISVWDFFWKGSLMLVKVKTIELLGGGINQPCHLRKKLLNISIPTSLEERSGQIMEDLVAAFTAHKDAGVLSQSSSFSFTLEV